MPSDNQNHTFSPEIRAFITEGLVTLEQALAMTEEQRNKIASVGVRVIREGLITIEQALAMTEEQRHYMSYPELRAVIAEGMITGDQVIVFTTAQLANIVLGQDAIREELITVEQALELTQDQRHNIESAGIRAAITEGCITFEQALALTDQQHRNIASEGVRAAITERLITLDQALALTWEQRNAIIDIDDETRAMLRNGELTLEDIIDRPEIPAAPEINGAQSTHTASVHKSASDSATRLMNLYGDYLNREGLDHIIARIQDELSHLSDAPKHKAAKNCIQRLASPAYTFVDPRSGIATRQLLALTFIAIDDSERMLGERTDALVMIVEGLYEMQRGYNINKWGRDNGLADSPACSAGTFNKFIEKLVGVHPDCEVLFITKETAGAKLPSVVQEEAMQYLSAYARHKTVSGVLHFTQCVTDIQKADDLACIYHQIKPRIIARIYDDFGSAYRDQQDPAFIALIDAGEAEGVPNLHTFQRSVQNSRGYHEYGSAILSRSTGGCFFSSSSAPLRRVRHDESPVDLGLWGVKALRR